jgi:hypothetical protein
MPIRIQEIASAECSWRQFARIRTGATMAHLISAAMRQRKGGVTGADAGQIGRKVRDPLRDQMNDGTLTLDAAAHAEHASG